MRRERTPLSLLINFQKALCSWLPPPLQTAVAASPSRTLPVRNAASGRFSDRGLVAEVGAAAPRRSPVHTVHLSAGSILQTRRGRPRLHLEQKTGGHTQTMPSQVVRQSEVCPSRALESATRALLRSQPSASAPSFHPYVLRCGRPPASGGWLGGCGHGAWGEPTPRATAPARKPGLRPRAPCEATAFKYTLGPTLRPSRI